MSTVGTTDNARRYHRIPDTVAELTPPDTLILQLRRLGHPFAYIEQRYIRYGYGQPGKDTLRRRYHQLKPLAHEFTAENVESLRKATDRYNDMDIDWERVRLYMVAVSKVGEWTIAELQAKHNTL